MRIKSLFFCLLISTFTLTSLPVHAELFKSKEAEPAAPSIKMPTKKHRKSKGSGLTAKQKRDARIKEREQKIEERKREREAKMNKAA